MKKLLQSLKLRLYLLKASIVYTYKVETAYAVNNLVGIISVGVFAISEIVFAEVIFFNTPNLAGLIKDELLLFFLISHCSFFINGAFVSRNLYDLVDSVNTGNLDLVLIRPIPSLFYVSTKQLSVMTLIREAVVPSFIYIYVINWSNIVTSPLQILVAIIIFIMGQYLLHFMQYMSAIPVFIFGQSTNLLDFSYVFDYRLGRMIPYDVLGQKLRLFFSTIIPVLIASGITLSVTVGNSNAYQMLGFVALTAFVCLIIENMTWRKMLKLYTSASS